MGQAAKKRRGSSRKKTQPTGVFRFLGGSGSDKRKSSNIQPSNGLMQALAVLVFGLGVFLALSFLSHELQFGYDDSHAIGLKGRNLLGPVGHMVATVIGGLLGWSIFIPIFWLFLLSRMAWREDTSLLRTEGSWILPPVGWCGVFISFSALVGLFFGRTGGGSLGIVLAEPLHRLFDLTGSLLVVAATLFLSLSLATSLNLNRMGALIGATIAVVGRIVFVQLPRVFLRAGLFLLAFIFILVKAMIRFSTFGRLGGDNAKAESEKSRRMVITPKVRKNSIPIIEEDDDEALLVQPEAEILVRRRSEYGNRRQKVKKARSVKEDSDQFAEPSFIGTYEPPDLDILTRGDPISTPEDDEELKSKSRQIEAKLKDFGILGRVTEVHPGPVITLFEFEPAAGIKVGRISNLADDLAMTLRAVSIRIIAPIPGKGTVGIEVPNIRRERVMLRDVLESEQSLQAESILSVCLGKDTYGDAVVTDIAQMPHLLIAGATGTGKSVCINAILLSLLYRATPAELGLILIDPKILELSVYEGIAHLRCPVVTVPRQAKAVLEWAVNEMNRRYRVMQKVGVRSIDGYNQVVKGEASPDELEPALDGGDIEEILNLAGEGNEVLAESEKLVPLPGEQLQPLPKIVIIIDELADLMLTVGREIEDLIARLAQKARAAGIHLIVATQRPSVDVITGLIKANFPVRLSFQVVSKVDSRTIIDSMGAEKLLGKGDMLFMPPGVSSLKRVHGAFVADSEVTSVIAAIKGNCRPNYDQNIINMCEKALNEDESDRKGETSSNGEEYDQLYDQAVQVLLEKGQISTSMVQRVFRIGYNRAARIVETMEREGLVGPSDGSRPRQLLSRGQEI